MRKVMQRDGKQRILKGTQREDDDLIAKTKAKFRSRCARTERQAKLRQPRPMGREISHSVFSRCETGLKSILAKGAESLQSDVEVGQVKWRCCTASEDTVPGFPSPSMRSERNIT
ncbi:hypothetical protein PMIN01_11156 [Paraphaeosphaeria minitans]|uniref:Uncharacterized protein n=1 Tax=Paraphaeosphaeria minitans TaxID=565426 RepID=A0A9P6KLS3_9PLEO|nr:hypothetical protein PMIN01_11156 [Paraphaeosphaeria minitans]